MGRYFEIAKNRLADLRARPLVPGSVMTSDGPGETLRDLSPPLPFGLTTRQLGRHQVVLGATGSGKSKYLELYGRYLIDNLTGFTFIDPHGDTAEALLEYATFQAESLGDDFLLHRLHYLEPTPEFVFRLDPFRSVSDEDYPTNPEFAKANRIHAAVDRLVRAFLRNYTQAEVEIMVRMGRWLRNALSGIAITHGLKRPLTVADVYALLDRRHGRHGEVFLALRPLMPDDIGRDFDRLESISEKRPQDQDHYVESSVNRLNAILSPMVQAIFAADTGPSFDYARVVREHGIVLVNLKETRHLSREQATVIGGLLIDELFSETALQAKQQRTDHHLIIDEAANFLGEDLEKILMQSRKWGLSLTLGGQSLRSFRKGEVDLFETISDCCSTFISFAQRNVRTVEILGKFFAYPNRILAERTDERDRHDGYMFLTLPDLSFGVSGGLGRGTSSQHSLTTGTGSQRGTAQTEGESAAETTGTSKSATNVKGSSYGSSDGTSQGTSAGENRSDHPMMIDGGYVHVPGVAGHMSPAIGPTIVNIPTTSTSSGGFSGASQGSFDSYSSSNAKTTGQMSAQTQGNTRSTTQSSAESTHRATTDGTGTSQSLNLGGNFGLSLKTSPLAKYRTEIVHTGEPKLSLPYQDAIHETLLTTLPDRIALCRVRRENGDITVLFQTNDCLPPYNDRAEAAAKTRAFQLRLMDAKPYIVRNPKLPETEQARRLDDFLGGLSESKLLPRNDLDEQTGLFP